MKVSNDTRDRLRQACYSYTRQCGVEPALISWVMTVTEILAAPSGDEVTYASLKDDAPHALNCECFSCDVERAGVDAELNSPEIPDSCGIPPAASLAEHDRKVLEEAWERFKASLGTTDGRPNELRLVFRPGLKNGYDYPQTLYADIPVEFFKPAILNQDTEGSTAPEADTIGEANNDAR